MEIMTFLADWDLGSFLKNATGTIETWGGLLLTLVGLIAVIYAVVKIVMGLASHGKKEVNWVVNIALLIIGGALSASGLSLALDIAKGGEKTIKDLGNVILALSYYPGFPKLF